MAAMRVRCDHVEIVSLMGDVGQKPRQQLRRVSIPWQDSTTRVRVAFARYFGGLLMLLTTTRSARGSSAPLPARDRARVAWNSNCAIASGDIFPSWRELNSPHRLCSPASFGNAATTCSMCPAAAASCPDFTSANTRLWQGVYVARGSSLERRLELLNSLCRGRLA